MHGFIWVLLNCNEANRFHLRTKSMCLQSKTDFGSYINGKYSGRTERLSRCFGELVEKTTPENKIISFQTIDYHSQCTWVCRNLFPLLIQARNSNKRKVSTNSTTYIAYRPNKRDIQNLNLNFKFWKWCPKKKSRPYSYQHRYERCRSRLLYTNKKGSIPNIC